MTVPLNDKIQTNSGDITINTNADRIISIKKDGRRIDNWTDSILKTKTKYCVIVDEESGKKNYEIYLLHYINGKVFVLLKFWLKPNELVISENFSEQFTSGLNNRAFTIGNNKTNKVYHLSDKIPHLTIHKDGNIFITFQNKNSISKKPIPLEKKLILQTTKKPERLLVMFPHKNISNYKEVIDTHYLSKYLKSGIFFSEQIPVSNSVIEIGILPHKSSKADGYLAIDEEENKDFLEDRSPIGVIVMKCNLLEYQIYLKLFPSRKEHEDKNGWFFQ